MSRRLTLLSTVSLVLASSIAAQDYEEVLARYKEYLNRPSLRKRDKGRKLLANTEDLRALEVLIKGYAKPEEPKDYVRYLIVTRTMRAFGADAPAVTLAAWRQRHKKSIDAWLWYQTLRKGPTESEEILPLVMEHGTMRKGNIYCLAAGFEASTQKLQRYAPDAFAADAALQLLADLPAKGIERALVLENLVSLLLHKKRVIREDPWKAVASRVIPCFEDEGTEQRTKIVMSRYFSKIFGMQNIGFQARYWLAELNKVSGRSKRSSGRTETASFFGIRTMGEHIVYVIDASDSMLKRVSEIEKKSYGPITGKKKAKLKEGIVPTGKDLDWSRIETRFDVAREFLRVSLESLQPHQNFAVILFGTTAEPLAATKKIVRATKSNIRRAITELHKIQAGPPTNARPDGVLRGFTNLHGGFRHAFRMTRSGLTKKAEYADKKAMLTGCDTIFMLSDGQPSADDWRQLDKAEPDDQAGDPETHEKHKKVPDMWFQGPFSYSDALIPDVRRLNLLRRVEIHCVGIGEANHGLLESIAEIGHGETIKIHHHNR